MQTGARNWGWLAVAAAVLLAIGWVALGQASLSPPTPTPVGLVRAPEVDLDRLDAGAAALPVPRAALADATRKCRLLRRAEDCRWAETLRAQAAKAGLD